MHLTLLVVAVLGADAPPSEGCLADATQASFETGQKKTLALETACPVEQIEIEGRLCGRTFTARFKACGKSYVCTTPWKDERAGHSCHAALGPSPK